MRGRLDNNSTISAREMSLHNISREDDKTYILPNHPLNRPKSYNKNNTINNKNNTINNNNNNNNNKDTDSQETYSALTQFAGEVYAATNSTLVPDDQYSALTSDEKYSALTSEEQYSALTLKGQYSRPIHTEQPKQDADYAVLNKENTKGADISNFFPLQNNNKQLTADSNYNAPIENDYFVLENNVNKNKENSTSSEMNAPVENEYFILENKNKVGSVEKKNEAMYSSLERFTEGHYT